MDDTMFDLHVEITAYIYELHELQKIIKELDQELMINPTEDNKLYMTETSDRYMKLCDKLKTVLEAYFAEERASGLPAEFSYRKLYRQLTA